MGCGKDGRTLTQTDGIWLSASRNLECSDMGETTITERPAGKERSSGRAFRAADRIGVFCPIYSSWRTTRGCPYQRRMDWLLDNTRALAGPWPRPRPRPTIRSVHRRSFLAVAAATPLAAATAFAADIPIIDTHIHLFDPTRPQSIPWPGKDNQMLYQPALPDRYRKIAAPLGISGAIEVECSPWLEDNQWVLDVAAKDSIIVGTVGDLEPGQPEFGKQLERFHRNPLFRGIRYGKF